MIRCSIHNHTTYCDGRDSAEDVIRAAIAQGFETVGISEHSVFPEDPPSGMTPEGEPALYAELMALREKYKGQIHVAAGIEQDTFSPPQQMPWEYVIGAVHYIRTDEGLTAVDLSPDVTKACIDRIFYGDAMAFAAPKPATASPVASPLRSWNQSIKVFTGERYPVPSPTPMIKP